MAAWRNPQDRGLLATELTERWTKVPQKEVLRGSPEFALGDRMWGSESKLSRVGRSRAPVPEPG